MEVGDVYYKESYQFRQKRKQELPNFKQYKSELKNVPSVRPLDEIQSAYPQVKIPTIKKYKKSNQPGSYKLGQKVEGETPE